MVASLELNEIERLDRKKHDRAAFTCKKPDYADYLQKLAGQDQDRRYSTCYVLTLKDSVEVIGYYTLSSGSIGLGELPEDVKKTIPKYPSVPATLIGRLAKSNKPEFKGVGLGEHLLMDALYRCLETSKEIASFVVVVEAEPDVAWFYEGIMHALPDQPNKFFLRMADIEKM